MHYKLTYAASENAYFLVDTTFGLKRIFNALIMTCNAALCE